MPQLTHNKVPLLLCCVSLLCVFQVHGSDMLNAVNSLTDGLTVQALDDESFPQLAVPSRGKYYNHKPATPSNHHNNNNHNNNKNCEEFKIKLILALNKLREQKNKCNSNAAFEKYSDCSLSVEEKEHRGRELESKLLKCQIDVDVLLAEHSILQETLSSCEGKNRVLAPQLQDLKSKASDLSAISARSQKYLEDCGMVTQSCRNTERDCHQKCLGNDNFSSSSSSSDSSD